LIKAGSNVLKEKNAVLTLKCILFHCSKQC
jgi:hypothetical protein